MSTRKDQISFAKYCFPIVFGDNEYYNSLSVNGQEYENPQVRDAVHFLLQEEMKTFAPSSSYLKHLPYPTLKYANSLMLEVNCHTVDI